MTFYGDSSGAEAFRVRRASAYDQVAAAWISVLGIPEVRPSDHFFELGGNSLLAVRVAALLRRSTGRRVRLADVLRHPVAADLSDAIGHADPDSASRPTNGDAAVHAVSFDQERRLLRDRIRPAPKWRIDLVFRLVGDVDVARLERAVEALVSRHEVLRSRFYLDDAGVPRRDLEVPDSRLFRYCDLQNSSGTAKEAIAEFQGAPFRRAHGDVFRAMVASTSHRSWLLLFGIDHFVCDRYSCDVLLRDLSRLYDVQENDAAEILPTQFSHYVGAQRELMRSARGDELRLFWKECLGETLSDAWPGVVPADFSADTPFGTVSAKLRIPRTVFSRPEAMAHLRYTPARVLQLAALNLTLAGLTGLRDHVVALPLGNRDDPEYLEVVGWISSLTAVRTCWEDCATSAELLDVTTSSYLAAVDHAMPWAEIIRICKPDSYAADPRQPQVYFDVLERDEEPLRIEGVQCERLPSGAYGGYAAFNLLVATDDDGWVVSVLANDMVFSPESSERLVLGYARAVEWLANAPAGSLEAAQRDVAQTVRGSSLDGEPAYRVQRSFIGYSDVAE